MMTRNLYYFIISIFLIGISCARQSSPTGGPKDSIPPVFIKSIPNKNQINYKGRTIELTFSEMILLNNPKEQIIIAPTTAIDYEVTSRKNKVIIKFEEDLKDSVTYSINFREAVQDITEKNPVPNLQLAFSTGPYIDSLSISGKVYTLLTGTIPKDVTVAIYEHHDTLSIFKHKPSYFTKSDAKGNFKLNNLKPGKYLVYAIDDKNKNLIADSKSEAYGFLSNPITLARDTQNISVSLIRLDARPLKLTSARPYNNYFNIKTAKNLSDFQITSAENKDTLISVYGEDYANIRIYNTFTTDSTLIKFSAQDSIGNNLDSTFYVKFSDRKVTPEKFVSSIDNSSLLEEKGILDISLHFNKPTFLINPDSLLFQIDSANIIQLKTGTLTWDTVNNNLSITKKIDPVLLKTNENEKKTPKERVPSRSSKPEIKNQLIIGKGTFISIDQDTVPKLTTNIRPLKNDELGVIVVKAQTKESNFIIELLDKDFVTLRKARNLKVVRWESLIPGSYRIRMIIDKNNNGKWDPGNFYTKVEPEPIVYYQNAKINPPNTTFLKANWEIDDLLITY